MKPSSVINDNGWEDDSPREGPLREFMPGELEKLEHALRNSEYGINDLSMSLDALRQKLLTECRHSYPYQPLLVEAAKACRDVRLARAELIRAQAQIFTLISRIEGLTG